MFERRGVIAIDKSGGVDEDEVMLMAIDAGAGDVLSDDEMIEVVTDTTSFSAVREALEKAGLSFAEADVRLVPSNTVEVAEEAQESVQRLLDMLEDNDDVQNVYHNAEM